MKFFVRAIVLLSFLFFVFTLGSYALRKRGLLGGGEDTRIDQLLHDLKDSVGESKDFAKGYLRGFLDD